MPGKPLFVQPVDGDPAITYTALELRQLVKALTGGFEGVIGDGSFTVTQRGAGANLSVDVATGMATVAGDDTADQANYLAVNTAVANLAVPAPPATGTRVHRVVLRVRDRLHNGAFTTYDWNLELLEDTGTGTPGVPASAISLATVSVAAGATSVTNANIADERLSFRRYRGTKRLARSTTDYPVGGVDSRITVGEGTAGGADPALTFYRTSSGASAGLAYRIRQPNSFDPLLLEAATADTEYGTESYATRLRIGPGNHTGHRGLEVWGIAGQTGDLLQCLTSDGTVVARVNSAGQISSAVILVDNVVGVGAHGLIGGGVNLKVGATAAGTVPLAVAGQSGQTGDLQRWQDSAGTVLARITAAGAFVGPSDTSAWTNYTPAWTTSGTAPAIGNGILTGRYRQIGKTVHVVIYWKAGSTTTFGSEAWNFSLPTNVSNATNASVNQRLMVSCRDDDGAGVEVKRLMGFATLSSSTARVWLTGVTSPVVAEVKAAAPFTWGTNDSLEIVGTYEAA